MENKKSYHFIAIGGVGQSALAKILAIKGFEVTGSDMNSSKYTKMLENLGVKVFIGHNKDNVKPGQTVVLSSAIKDDNLELIRAKELNLPLYHRSDALKFISENYPCFIGFSGTHGKTTTSSLCSYILEKIGAHPSYAVGGIVTGLNTNANAYKDSEIFVAELDESDGTIVKYSPDYIVINNLEPDHFDFYKNGEADLINQFDKFFENLKSNSKVFVNIDDIGIQDFLKTVNPKNLITYSIKNENADYFAKDINTNTEFNSFKLYYKKGPLGEIKTKIKGVHNVTNTLAVVAVLIEKGFKLDELLASLYSFEGAKRRFETVYNGAIKIIDDYAHHPTEIKATLKAANELVNKQAANQPKGRIVALFQPHRYTRLKALWKDFLNSFEFADELFVADAFSAGDKFDETYNSCNFAKEIGAKYIKGNMEEFAKEVYKHLKPGDFVLTIGAGDITKVGVILRGYYEKQ